jgi:hypothetical protein
MGDRGRRRKGPGQGTFVDWLDPCALATCLPTYTTIGPWRTAEACGYWGIVGLTHPLFCHPTLQHSVSHLVLLAWPWVPHSHLSPGVLLVGSWKQLGHWSWMVGVSWLGWASPGWGPGLGRVPSAHSQLPSPWTSMMLWRSKGGAYPCMPWAIGFPQNTSSFFLVLELFFVWVWTPRGPKNVIFHPYSTVVDVYCAPTLCLVPFWNSWYVLDQLIPVTTLQGRFYPWVYVGELDHGNIESLLMVSCRAEVHSITAWLWTECQVWALSTYPQVASRERWCTWSIANASQEALLIALSRGRLLEKEWGLVLCWIHHFLNAGPPLATWSWGGHKHTQGSYNYCWHHSNVCDT